MLDLPSGMMYEAAEGTRFVVFPSPNAGQAPQTCMGFATSDIERDVRDLKARGVTFEEYDLPNFKTVDSIMTDGIHALGVVPRLGGQHPGDRAAARGVAAGDDQPLISVPMAW